MVDYLKSIIGQTFESHEVTNILTNANPVTMAFLAHGWKGCIIHMVVARLVHRFKMEQGTNVIGSASGQAEQGHTFDIVRVAIVEDKAYIRAHCHQR